MTDPEEAGLVLPSSREASTVTIEPVHRRIRMFSISEDELDNLASGYSSIDQVMFGITAGGLISFVIVFLTVPLQGNALSIAVALLAVSLLGVVTFGLRVIAGIRSARAHARRLKQQWPFTSA